jgi:hypothetical protein
MRVVVEVEQSVERAGFLVCGAIGDATEVPIVLDEAEDGGLVGHAMASAVSRWGLAQQHAAEEDAEPEDQRRRSAYPAWKLQTGRQAFVM